MLHGSFGATQLGLAAPFCKGQHPPSVAGTRGELQMPFPPRASSLPSLFGSKGSLPRFHK